MSLIKGEPDLKFVIKKAGKADEVVLLKGWSDFTEDYDPQFVSHELQDHELRRKLKGFRYHADIYFEKYIAENVVPLAKIVHRTGYDQILFFPNSIDKPLFKLDVTIDDDTIKLAYLYMLGHKDLRLKLIGRILEDWVPLTLADFTMWGNISLQFSSLNTPYSQLP